MPPAVLEEPRATELFPIPDEVGAELRVSRLDPRRLRDASLGPSYVTIRYRHACVDQWHVEHPNGIGIAGRRSLPRAHVVGVHVVSD